MKQECKTQATFCLSLLFLKKYFQLFEFI